MSDCAFIFSDPESFGTWAVHCNELFLFGPKSVNIFFPFFLMINNKYSYVRQADWESNYKICCSLGMQPVNIFSSAKPTLADCMNNATSSKHFSY
jgi:hypothetical protein